MEQFTYRENPELGKEFTPSEWDGEPEYLPITRIKMTCGGGMGGQSWYEYIHRIKDIPNNAIMKCRRYDGKEIVINTAFLVEAEEFTLASAKLDITGWARASRERLENYIKTYHVLIDDGKQLKLNGSYL